jgi:hypothetical protein
MYPPRIGVTASEGCLGSGVGAGFEWMIRGRDREPVSRGGRGLCPLLLHHVRQLMGEEPATRRRAGLVASLAEGYVAPDRVSERPDGPGRLGRPGIRVDAHSAEVVPEAGFEGSTCPFVQRPTR